VSARRRERGFALLIVLALTVIVTAIVALAQERAGLDLVRTRNVVVADRALAYQLGAEDWVAQLLRRDAEDDIVDSLVEDWARGSHDLQLEDGAMMHGAIEDLQGRFNVNDLLAEDGSVDEAALAQLQRLLTGLGVAEPERVVAAIVDWIDADQDLRAPYGAEDSVYLRRDPPYRTADAPLRWVGELRLVDGIDATGFALMAPHLTALPARTAINVNTATPAVIASLAEDVDPGTVERIVARQRDAPFHSVDDFKRELGRDLPQGVLLSVETGWFALRTAAVVEGLTVNLYSVLARAPGGATRTVRRSTDLVP